MLVGVVVVDPIVGVKVSETFTLGVSVGTAEGVGEDVASPVDDVSDDEGIGEGIEEVGYPVAGRVMKGEFEGDDDEGNEVEEMSVGTLDGAEEGGTEPKSPAQISPKNQQSGTLVGDGVGILVFAMESILKFPNGAGVGACETKSLLQIRPKNQQL